MLSLIEVKCPHCGAEGQIMAPPPGAVIIGPCPACKGMVVVFCGSVLALDKEIIRNGGPEERREHLLEVLGGFVEDRVDRLMEAAEAAPGDPLLDEATDAEEESEEQDGVVPYSGKAPESISDAELDSFRNVDLKLLDSKAYFKAVFG